MLRFDHLFPNASAQDFALFTLALQSAISRAEQSRPARVFRSRKMPRSPVRNVGVNSRSVKHALRHLFALALIVLGPLASAQQVTIGVGNFKPYFDGNSGLFTDLIIEVFKEMP